MCLKTFKKKIAVSAVLYILIRSIYLIDSIAQLNIKFKWLLVLQSAFTVALVVSFYTYMFMQYFENSWSSLEPSGSLTLPAVFGAPIRIDVVQQVHSA